MAVLAHIRHNHTRYDELLKEVGWENARKVVEEICFDVLVKWRGDEETGRDQLDELLREVVVISDSESDEDDYDEDESSSTSLSDVAPAAGEDPVPAKAATYRRGDSRPRIHHAGRKSKLARKDRRAAMNSQRGFSRYQAAHERAQATLDRKWVEALERQRAGAHMSARSLDGPAQPQPQRAESYYGKPNLGLNLRTPGAFQYASQPPVGGNSQSMQRSGPALPADVLVEQARWSGQDMKDHPVRSIESYSPESSHFSLQSTGPVHYPQPPEGGGISAADGHQLSENKDFITLTQRPLPPRSYYPVEVAGNHQQSEYRHGSTIHNGRPLFRSESRPIWVEDEDSILRSERNPVLIVQEGPMPPRQMVPASYPGQRAPGVNIIHPQTSHPVYPDDEHFRQVGNRPTHNGPTKRLSNDLGDFVRVTNKFPRRHEPSFPVQERSYGGWAGGFAGHNATHNAEQAVESVRQHSQQPVPVLFQREESSYRQASVLEHTRVTPMPSGHFQRQERVVGIQYLPAQPR